VRHVRRAAAARFAALRLLLLLLTCWICCAGCFDGDFGAGDILAAMLSPYFDPLTFADEYANHVRAADEPEDELTRWQARCYAEGATIPDINETRARIKLPAGENVGSDDSPLRSIKVEMNILWYTGGGRQFEGAFFKNISRPGDMPVLKLVIATGPVEVGEPPREEAEEAIEYPVEYHHTSHIAKDRLHVTFELWGTDSQTGEPAGERHVVEFKLLDALNPDDRHAQPRAADAPHFVVTSHTIEALAPEPDE
jgi:hypothetical protein